MLLCKNIFLLFMWATTVSCDKKGFLINHKAKVATFELLVQIENITENAKSHLKVVLNYYVHH